MHGRFAIFGAQDPHAIMPRLDPLARERRLDVNAPLVGAYLGGRPVVLARPDPRTRRPGMPSDLTVPLTLSRFQHAIDIERGYDPRSWEPTPLVGTGLDALASAGAVYLAAIGALGAAAGYGVARGLGTDPKLPMVGGAAVAMVSVYLSA
jgi:hypothetical protein